MVRQAGWQTRGEQRLTKTPTPNPSTPTSPPPSRTYILRLVLSVCDCSASTTAPRLNQLSQAEWLRWVWAGPGPGWAFK